mgnify:CR=1 FL=1
MEALQKLRPSLGHGLFPLHQPLQTAAFALPILERLREHRKARPRALIIAPTRELATQIAEQTRALARHTGLRVITIFGGVSQHEIAEELRNAGFEIDDRYVRIGEQIKRLDSYEIPVVINKDLKTHIKLWVVSDKSKEELEAEAKEEAARLKAELAAEKAEEEAEMAAKDAE